MYEETFGLDGKPFQLAPDPRFYFNSKGHQRAMAYLRYGIQQGQGFIVITGDVGTGKSTLVTMLFRELEKHDLVAAKIVSTNIREHDLLRMVASGFGLKFDRVSKAGLLKRLEEHFIGYRREGKRVLLVVDECQNLPARSLEELRMLSNFEFEGEPLMQSFLLGQREFRRTMRSDGFEQLRQRVIAAYHLKPLSENETRRYIEHRLRKVGWNDDPAFGEGVFEEIFNFTRGVPRRINTLCDRLLLNAALDEAHTIDLQRLQAVIGELQVEYGEIGEETGEHLTDDEPRQGSTGSAASSDLNKLEARLTSLQNSLELMARTLQANVVQQSTGRYPVERKSKSTPVWTIAFAATAAFLLIGGLAAVLLFLK